MSADAELPVARVERDGGARWTRFLPLAALVLALVLLRQAWRERGPLLGIRAADGHGLAPGDALRYRGIEVGKVEELALSATAREVVLHVRLARSARALARAGARFWIARPVLGVEGVRGLETALGARYLAVLPGPPAGAPQTEFVALEEPPLYESEDPEALEIVLQASERAGLARGAPVLYRGIPIGALVSVGLASDATAVEARARIDAQHAELVRIDSRFYRAPAAQLSLGFGGLELAVHSLQSLWLGGVALATPTQPGARAPTGRRFELAAEPEEEWLAWRPALPVGAAFGGEVQAPARSWARLVWKPRGWFARAHARSGWLVREDERLLGPADLLLAPDEAEAGSVFLELGGERFELGGAPAWSAGGLARRPHPGTAGVRPAEARALLEPEDLLLLADPALAPMAIAAGHLERRQEGWAVAAEWSFDERWHGAVALGRRDGLWVGILLVSDGRGRVVPVPSP